MTDEAPPGSWNVPLLRELKLIAWAQWLVVAWAWWYTTDLTFRAPYVTSRQWLYLMSTPGHHWSWVALFGSGAIILTTGMLTGRYVLRAIGLAVLGFGAFFIAAFYIAAPLIDPGLMTLGYQSWLPTCAPLLLLAVVNWRPVRCF